MAQEYNTEDFYKQFYNDDEEGQDKINIESEGNPFGDKNDYYGSNGTNELKMDEIKEEEDDTQRQYSTSQYSEAKKHKMIFHQQPDDQAIDFERRSNNPIEAFERRAPQTAAGGYRPRKTNIKALNHDELITEINELKKSNRKDVDEIKRLKVEQQKIESLYRKYKEQQNDVFTAERLIAKNDIKLNTNDFPIINKNNLMTEIEKVKKMLMNKIKTGQISKGHSSYLSKRSKNSAKINIKGKVNNLVCKSCKMMMNSKQESDKISGIAPDDSINKTIVRIQIKKLKELKTTLEQDLRKKEAELEKIRKTNSLDNERATEKELKKSLNILKGLKKKLIKLKAENGSAFEQDLDPIIKAIDKELNKNRKWKAKAEDEDDPRATEFNVLESKEQADENNADEELKENQEEQVQKQNNELDSNQAIENNEKLENIDENKEEKELKRKLEELEKELALSDEEFEKRLIERLKKEIKSNKTKLEKGLKKEFIQKQKEIYKKKDEEIERLKRENEELANYISRIKILLSS